MLETIVNIGRGVKDFLSSDTVKTIADGAKTVLDYMKERSTDVKEMGRLESLGDPNTKISGRVGTSVSRSRAGKPGYGDIQEATFYKYAQLQNTVRYLYSQKSRYKSIAKDKA